MRGPKPLAEQFLFDDVTPCDFVGVQMSFFRNLSRGVVGQIVCRAVIQPDSVFKLPNFGYCSCEDL